MQEGGSRSNPLRFTRLSAVEDAAAPRLEFRELGQRHASDGEDDDKRLNDVGHAGGHAGSGLHGGVCRVYPAGPPARPVCGAGAGAVCVLCCDLAGVQRCTIQYTGIYSRNVRGRD